MFNLQKIKNLNINIKKDKSIYDDWANCKTAEGYFSCIDRLPNPDIILRKMGKGISILRELENHYQVGTCIESRKAGTMSKDFKLIEQNTPKAHFDLYKDIFNILDVNKLIEDILDASLYGYNPIELTWEKDGNYIIPVKAVAKPQEWFYFNSEGEFFYKDRTRGGKRQIDLEGFKFLLPRNKATYVNPYGCAILSRCFWNVAFINGGMEFWVKFSEKLGMPWVFGKYDRSMTDQEKKSFLTALVNMVQDAVGIIPNDGSVEVMQTGSTGNSEIYKLLVDKCENNISKAILGQTLTTDVGSVGSFAAGKVHADVRSDIVQSDTNLVVSTIKRLIQLINAINFADDEVPIYGVVQEDFGLERAERDQKVQSLGVRFSKDYIVKTYGYNDKDIEIVTPQSGVTEFSDSEDNPNGTKKDLQGTELLETITDLKDFENVLNPALNSIIEFFNTTRDAEETMEKLADVYPDLDTQKLEDILTKVIFISSLLGSGDVKNGK